MEIHYIIEGVLAAGGFMVAIIIKRAYQSIDDLWRKQDEMTRRLTEMAIELPKNYVTKNDLSQAMDIVHNRFDKIDTKLEKISSLMPRTRKMSDTQ
jgi:UTP-glucose-1-phosphate uridylyltransferase